MEHPNSHVAELQTLPAPSVAKRVLRRVAPVSLRYRVRTRLLETPLIAEALLAADPIMRVRHRVTRQTRIVIDGFPRSANSYARAAFEYDNGIDGVVSHVHSFRSLQLGVRYAVPTLALIRDPRPVVASAYQYDRDVPPIVGIRNWIRFYEHVLPLTDRLIVGVFEQVTADFGDVVERLNSRYGTSFVPYKRTPESEAAVLAEIDEWTRAMVDPDQQEQAYSRPNEKRRTADEVLAELDPRATRLLARASALYDEVVAAAAR